MRKRRIICLALTVLMLVCLLPIGALADGATSGKCGDNITWTLDSNGILKLSGVGAMYDYDFDGSDGLPQVPWDHTAVKTVVIGEGITSVGRCSFLDCSNMTKVTLPSTLSKIGELGFAYCYKIASLSIPNGVTEIGASAFICTSLRSINIPGSVKTIGDSAFVECNMVKDVVVGEGVEAIGTRAFELYNVETIYLPKTLKSIDSTSFSNCNNLSVIYFGGTEEEWYNLVGEQSTVYDDIMVFIECTMFDDVSDPAAYYWSPVMWAYAYGITDGMSPTTFVPGGPCTRGQFVTFLWRLLGEEAPQDGYTGQFVDVPEGDYYSDAVAWAASYGIVNGIDKTHFNPSGKITRAQAVTMLWRIMGEPDDGIDGCILHDVERGSYYEAAVGWATEERIVYGMTVDTFEPYTTCTRGMTVTYLYRFVNYLASSQEG